MVRPKDTHIRMAISDDLKTIVIQVHSTPQMALNLYDKLEQILLEALRLDLETDWQDDNPDQK